MIFLPIICYSVGSRRIWKAMIPSVLARPSRCAALLLKLLHRRQLLMRHPRRLMPRIPLLLMVESKDPCLLHNLRIAIEEDLLALRKVIIAVLHPTSTFSQILSPTLLSISHLTHAEKQKVEIRQPPWLNQTVYLQTYILIV